MARKRPGHLLPFRIPFFRIFYSSSYTTIYFIILCLLAITPVSMIWQSSTSKALQYTIMIGGTYVLTGAIAIFIYASRLYTNRTALAGVGKAYVPVEEGEIGKSVRRMIVRQLERSAIIAWESRPRDLHGEVLLAERLERHDDTVGSEIPVHPAHPPWGDVKHRGWSSPNHRDDVQMSDLQFTTVSKELPNLIEAKAVSLAPADPTATPTEGQPMADPAVTDVLRRPEMMGMRDYLMQLSYLGLVNPTEAGQRFLSQYENARFGGLPITEPQFKSLMAAFAELLSGMTGLKKAMVDQIREQSDNASLLEVKEPVPQIASSPPRTPDSSTESPITAWTAPSRNVTPYLQQYPSTESVGSVLHETSGEPTPVPQRQTGSVRSSFESESLASDAGSVLRHSQNPEIG